MGSITAQRDLVNYVKKETVLNLGILSNLHSLPTDLSRQIFKENALEKPTQGIFNNVSYYLVTIIDSQVSSKLPWPLYDTKTEKSYRNEFSNFVSSYSKKGLLSPVISSYFVNPGCYKVTMLIFQLSQLAVQRTLVAKLTKDNSDKLQKYSEVTEKYQTKSCGDFVESIERETEIMQSKFTNYLHKRKAYEEMAGIFRKKILEMQEKLTTSKAQEYLNTLVDGFVKDHTLDQSTEKDLVSVKNVNVTPAILDVWLAEADEHITEMETNWERQAAPLLEISRKVRKDSEALIARYTGEADKDTYMIEFNPRTDNICTKELQTLVNSEQKYILKNIIKDERLNFPNLIRGFLIAISFILKGLDIGDDIYKFNEYLEGGQRNFQEMVSGLKVLVDRVMNAEAKLESTPSRSFNNQSVSLKDIPEIPPLPDLSDLKINKENYGQVMFDTFTPWSFSKHQFNLGKRNGGLGKSQPKSLVTPFHTAPRDDFLKSLISCRVSSYDRANQSHNFHNMSVISQITRANETISECTAGFTKQQILRLMSTKKSSSSKKMKYKLERPNINIKKGGLFNESISSNESNGLYRSHSSPNLFEGRDKMSRARLQARKLSVMREDSPTLLEVSGITALEGDNFNPPRGDLESTRKMLDTTSMPVIVVTPGPEEKVKTILQNIDIDFNKIIEDTEPITVLETSETPEISVKENSKTETPVSNAHRVKRTSSLEKIINRFKKVRASVIPFDKKEEDSEFRTIVEEKENFNTVNVDVFATNKVLLPDVLPSCNFNKESYIGQVDIDISENKFVPRRPRESLGTALGVDETFLDQFDLID